MKKTLNDRIYDFFLVFIQKVCHITCCDNKNKYLIPCIPRSENIIEMNIFKCFSLISLMLNFNKII